MSSQVPPYLILSLNSRRALIERPHTFQEAIERTREAFPEILQSEIPSFITRDLSTDFTGGGEVEVAPSAWRLLAADPSIKQVTIQRSMPRTTTSTISPILNTSSPTPRPQTFSFGETDTNIRTPQTTQHVWVKLHTGKMLSFEVPKPALVQTIKQKVQESQGIPTQRIRLMLGITELQDGRSLDQYTFQGMASLPLLVQVQVLSPPIQIFVRNAGGKTLAFDVEATDTVADLKTKVQDREGIPSGHQRLMYSGKLLEDDRALIHYNIQKMSTIQLVLVAKVEALLPPMQVFVRNTGGKTLTFDVEATDTVADLKTKIQDREGIPSRHQRLMFSGKLLEDDRTLRDYNITWMSIIQLVRAPSAALRIGKPVIYLFPPSSLEGATIDLSLVPQWRFTSLYPISPIAMTSDGFQKVRWQVDARADGSMFDYGSQSEISYLFWEADAELKPHPRTPTSSRPVSPSLTLEPFDPSYPDISPSNSVVLSQSALTSYLDNTLKALSLHTEARTSFITYWLPSFLKHSQIAIRFVPQKSYAEAAPMRVTPTPDVITRIFMLFKGIKAEELEIWEEARRRAGEGCDMWKQVVGLEEDLVYNKGVFRVLEWGGTEVL